MRPLPVRPLTPLRLSITTAPSPIAPEPVFRCRATSQRNNHDSTKPYYAMVCGSSRDGNWYKYLLPLRTAANESRIAFLIGMRIPPAWFASGSMEPYQPELSTCKPVYSVSNQQKLSPPSMAG